MFLKNKTHRYIISNPLNPPGYLKHSKGIRMTEIQSRHFLAFSRVPRPICRIYSRLVVTRYPRSFLHPINIQKPHKLTVLSALRPSTSDEILSWKHPHRERIGCSPETKVTYPCGELYRIRPIRVAPHSVHRPPLIQLNKEDSPRQITA